MSRRPKYDHKLMRFQWEHGFSRTLKDLGAKHGCPEDYVRKLKYRQGWADPKAYDRRVIDQVVAKWVTEDSNSLAIVEDMKLTLARALFGMAGNALKQTEYVNEPDGQGGLRKVERQVFRPQSLNDVLALVRFSVPLTNGALRIAAAAAKVDIDDVPWSTGADPGPGGRAAPRRDGDRVGSAQELIEMIGRAQSHPGEGRPATALLSGPPGATAPVAAGSMASSDPPRAGTDRAPSPSAEPDPPGPSEPPLPPAAVRT